MSSIMNSQGVVLATAMAAAVSGTVILLALGIPKSIPSHYSSLSRVDSLPVLRPCLSSGDRKGERKKKKVRFAKDVVDPTGDSVVFRRQHSIAGGKNVPTRDQIKRMPENRAALYNGLLRDRVVHRRLACTY